MSEIDPAAVMDEHRRQAIGSWSGCDICDDAHWPCLPYRLASDLAASEAKVARALNLQRYSEDEHDGVYVLSSDLEAVFAQPTAR